MDAHKKPTISPNVWCLFDGKLNSLSGRSSNFNRLSPSSSRRISVEEWPAHFLHLVANDFPWERRKFGEKKEFHPLELKLKHH